MSCLEVRSLLALRSLAVLEEDEESLVARHLPGCAKCRAESDDLDAVKAVIAKDETRPVPAEKRDAIWAGVLGELTKPRSAESAPAVTSADLSIAVACSYCHDQLERAEACYCASCLAPHHEDCWQTHGRCSAPGCEETLTVKPRGGEAPRRVAQPQAWRIVTLVGVLAAMGGGGYVAARWPVRSASSSRAETPRSAKAPVTPERPRSWKTWPPADNIRIAIDVKDADLRSVVADIASRSSHTIVVAPDVHEKVTMARRSIHWEDALEEIAKSCRCEVARLGEEALLVDRERSISLKLDRVDLRAVVDQIATQARKNIVVSPACPPTLASAEFVKANWLQALRSTLETYDVHAEVKNGIIVVLPEPGPALPDSAGGAPAPPTPLRTDGTGRVDLAFEDVDLRDACDELGRRVGRNIIVEPEIQEKVTFAAKRAPWHDVLLAFVLLGRCEIDQRGSIAVVVRPRKVSLRARSAAAGEWFHLLASSLGSNVVAAEDLKGTVTCDLHDVTWRDALEATCLAGGYELHEDAGQILRVTPPRSAAKEGAK